jgi:hypothetical protein
MAGGVGKSTDILVIKKDGIYQVDDTTIQALEEIYDERESGSQRQAFDKRISEFTPEVSKHKAG